MSQSLRKSGQFLPISRFEYDDLLESQSLRKSGQFLPTPKIHRSTRLCMGRNPFVSQVNFFFRNNVFQYERKNHEKSQSLRKSGQFLLFKKEFPISQPYTVAIPS